MPVEATSACGFWPLVTELFTCSALSMALLLRFHCELSHTEHTSSERGHETPLCQVLVFPVFLLCAIGL